MERILTIHFILELENEENQDNALENDNKQANSKGNTDDEIDGYELLEFKEEEQQAECVEKKEASTRKSDVIFTDDDIPAKRPKLLTAESDDSDDDFATQLLEGQQLEVHSVVFLFILLSEKFLSFDWLRAEVFQPSLKYLHVKITVTMVTQNHQIISSLELRKNEGKISRFRNREIQELKENSENQNAEKSTPNWLNVWTS